MIDKRTALLIIGCCLSVGLGFMLGIHSQNTELEFYREYAKFPFSQGLMIGSQATLMEFINIHPEDINLDVNSFSKPYINFMIYQYGLDQNGISCWLADTGELTIIRGDEKSWDKDSSKCKKYFDNVPKPNKQILSGLMGEPV